MTACTDGDADPVTAYARAVVDGDQPAGKWLRLAGQRHLRDVAAAAEDPTSVYHWRPDLADKAIRLFRLMKHYKGEWGGHPIVLEPWQQFIVGSVFGWVARETGFRRFRNCFVELARGNGKSTLAAGLLIILTFFDHEPGAEGYAFATKRDQALIVFRTARQMVLRSSAIREFVTVWRHNLHDDTSESKLEALGADADTLDGLRPHAAVGDEIHRHPTADVVEVIESGMGTRRQPLLFLITTAGESDGVDTVYGQQYSISTQVLEGAVDIPEWFAFIAAADPEDDWAEETTWRKANPNWGVSVKPEFVRKEYQKALANPAEQPKFRRLYLGQKVSTVEAYLSLADWDACPPWPDEATLREAPCWLGLDLSSSVDVTAAVLVWRLGPDEIALRATCWLPGANLEERRRRDRVPYHAWAGSWLTLTEGNTIDRSEVRRAVAAQAKDWRVKAICYDPWQAAELVQQLQDDDGLPVLAVPQRFATLSEPTKALQALILRRRVRHDANPLLRWMVSNLAVRTDDRENMMPCKKRSRGRIDGLQATITALTQALVKPPAESVYATRDLLVL
jgi:phage terminase large subunit-like protein